MKLNALLQKITNRFRKRSAPVAGSGQKEVTCPVCGGDSRESFQSKCYKVYLCRRCSHLFADSSTMGDDIGHGSTGEGNVYLDNLERYFKRDRHLVSRLQQLGLIGRHGSVLDIGVGSGHLFRIVDDICEPKEHYGIEPSSAYQAYYAQAGINENIFPAFDQLPVDHLFDMAFMIEVIEHVRDPVSLLREARCRLRSGGTLFLTTPAGDTRNGVASPKQLSAYNTCEHIQFFTEKSLDRSLVKAGFQDIEFISIPEFYVFADSLPNDIEAKRAGLEENFKRGNCQHLTFIATAAS